MSTKKGKKTKTATEKRSTSANRHQQPRESFHLPEELREALTAYVESLEAPPKKSVVMRVALERYLAEKGFWTLKGKSPEDD